jgi:seryl-tRNA synthetase
VKKEMGLNKKNKGDPAEFEKLKAEKDALTKEKQELEDLAKSKYAELMKKTKSVGNYVHESVPLSDNEDNNKLERSWAPEGVAVEKKDCLSHHEVLHRLDGYDPERGVKIVGHRGYCLTGYGLFLNLALVNYGLEFLFNRGYKPNQPPFFMLREAMAKTAQLEQFDEELYKVTEKENDPATDKYLIATSEQPISAMHESEWLNDKDLPIKYAGYSTNFRKEAGSHGKDAWGLFRVHQFEKIEQFIFCKPEDSWTHFDQMIDTSEEFYKSLGLPHRVVGIVSGALNNAAAKKYDLEAWFPFQGEYKELVSCSNCTDYQTRELEIRYVVTLSTLPTPT